MKKRWYKVQEKGTLDPSGRVLAEDRYAAIKSFALRNVKPSQWSSMMADDFSASLI